jgi:ribA/ribD-fused uncharacterized protein
MAQIKFFSNKAKYFEFSNFYPAEIKFDGLTFPTTEHCFQWRKFAKTAPDHAEKIRCASQPSEAFKLGKSREFKIDPEWEEIKVDFMKKIVREKMQQHPAIVELLLKTGKVEIIEASPYDGFWGSAKGGLNHLGKILMELRQELRESKKLT